MSVLEVKDVKFRYDSSELYNNISFRLFTGEHAVLVGDNGTGKSTLLKLLAKELTPDAGSISFTNNIKVGYLDQYAKIDPNIDVKTYLYDVFIPLFNEEKKLQKLYESLQTKDEKYHQSILEQAHKITLDLENKGFYMIQSKVSNVLNGLGLGTNLLDTPVKHLSGGMRSKLILANLLLKEADCLLLDEPTNFLDVAHVDWLAKFLNSYQKSFIVISHNEAFLKEISTTVFLLANKTIERYKGNYDFFLTENAIRQNTISKAYDTQVKFIKKTEDFIQKNIVRASTTKRAQARRKMLEKIVRIEKPTIKSSISFRFLPGRSLGVDVLKVKNLEIGYDTLLVEPITTQIKKGEKIVITGHNGVGKTTFVKTVLGLIPALGGTYKWADSAQIMYFEQDMLADETITAFDLILASSPNLVKKQIYSILGNYKISQDLALRPINTLSGGEKARVKFAVIRNQKSNILILDEPTNHLDFDTKAALKQALIDYPETIILVSHEKEFYQDICNVEIKLGD